MGSNYRCGSKKECIHKGHLRKRCIVSQFRANAKHLRDVLCVVRIRRVAPLFAHAFHLEFPEFISYSIWSVNLCCSCRWQCGYPIELYTTINSNAHRVIFKWTRIEHTHKQIRINVHIWYYLWYALTSYAACLSLRAYFICPYGYEIICHRNRCPSLSARPPLHIWKHQLSFGYRRVGIAHLGTSRIQAFCIQNRAAYSFMHSFTHCAYLYDIRTHTCSVRTPHTSIQFVLACSCLHGHDTDWDTRRWSMYRAPNHVVVMMSSPQYTHTHHNESLEFPNYVLVCSFVHSRCYFYGDSHHHIAYTRGVYIIYICIHSVLCRHRNVKKQKEKKCGRRHSTHCANKHKQTAAAAAAVFDGKANSQQPTAYDHIESFAWNHETQT